MKTDDIDGRGRWLIHMDEAEEAYSRVRSEDHTDGNFKNDVVLSSHGGLEDFSRLSASTPVRSADRRSASPEVTMSTK